MRTLFYRAILNVISLIIAPFLLAAYSIKKYKIFVLYNSRRIGHFALNVELFLRREESGITEDGIHYFLISTGERSNGIANKYLHSMQRRYVSSRPHVHYIASSIFYHILMHIYKKEIFSKLFYTSYYHSNEVEFSKINNVLFFNNSEHNKGKKILKSVGIDIDNEKIVCIFARDDAYLKSIDTCADWSHHSFRDMNVDDYIKSIKYLIGKGYKVIRVGSVAKQQVNLKNNNFFDYSFSNIKSDFMDLFLIHISHFVVGNSSGMVDLAIMFNRPLLIVNGVPFTYAPLGKKDMYIHKKVINAKTGEILPFYELLTMGISVEALGEEQVFRLKYGLKYKDNTENEICSAVIDMEAYVNGTLSYKKEVKKYYLEYWKITKNNHISSLVSPSWVKENKYLYYKSIEN